MVANGRIPLTSMTTLLDGQRLLTPQARSVLTLVHVAKLEGIAIHPPTGGDRGISGYRDAARQALFIRASHGDREAAARCNIDPTMKTNMGAVGYQSHGYGNRIDLLFNGHSPDTSDLALVRRYGGVQEFGDDDRNHFRFTGSVTSPRDEDINRIVARYLNGQHLGRTTTTDDDGEWPAESNFSWMLQEYGSKRKGWYPQPQYKIDGIAGTRTKWVRNKIMSNLWNS